MKRVLAVVVAVGMVVGAVLARRVLDGDDDGGGSPEGNGTTMRVVCAEEMRDSCESLGFGRRFEITIEDAAVTAGRLEGSDGGTVLDIWAVTQPWPAIVDEARTRAGLSPLFGAVPVVVGSSQLVLVGGPDLDGCDWRCIGERGAEGLKLGGRSLDSGAGLLTVGAAAAGWFGRSDFATNDFDPAFDRWLSGLVGAVERSAAPVTQLLQSRAFFDAALSFEAEAGPALRDASADRTDGLLLLRPSPTATLVGVVVTAPSGLESESNAFAPSLQQSLADHGWTGEAPATTGLPSPGVLTALRDRVSR